MDNSNSLSNTILQPSAPIQLNNTPTQDNSGFFDTLKNINITTWILIFLILAFLGFNIFTYLAKGTEDITNFFAPLLKNIFGVTLAVTGQTVDVAAEGAKTVVSGTATTLNTGLTGIQNVTPNTATTSITTQPIQTKTSLPPDTPLNKKLNNSQGQYNDYDAHEASSSVHSAGKPGWCFIGEDRGFRSCALVNEDDRCMSGDIFPSQELCINPSLRA